jgi:hypothetical protein
MPVVATSTERYDRGAASVPSVDGLAHPLHAFLLCCCTLRVMEAALL